MSKPADYGSGGMHVAGRGTFPQMLKINKCGEENGCGHNEGKDGHSLQSVASFPPIVFDHSTASIC